MNFKTSERPWLLGGMLAAIVIAALSWFFAISPELSKASATQSEVADAQTQNDVLQSKTAKLKSESDQLPTFAAQLSQKLTLLPTDAEFTQLTTTMSAQAKKAGVSITTLNLGVPTNPGGSKTTYQIPVSLVSTGSITNQRRFLGELQTSGSRAALISSVNFVPTNNSAGSSISSNNTMSVSLNVFWTPLTATATNALLDQLKSAGAGN